MNKLTVNLWKIRQVDLKARLAIARGNNQEAVVWIDWLKTKIPANDTVLLNIAQLYALLGIWDQAEEYFNRSYPLRNINFRNILLMDKFPEDSPIHKIPDKPVLRELFEIRKENMRPN